MVKNKEQVFISLVAYISDLNKEILLEKCNFIKNNFTEYEIILVSENNINSNSLSNIVKDENLNITLINVAENTGIENSLKAGIDFSIGDIVVTLNNINLQIQDIDLQNAYNELSAGFDIISLSPNKVLKSSELYYGIMNKLGLENNIYTEVATVITRRAINKLNKYNFTVMYRKALYGSLGYNHKWLKIDVKYNNNENIYKKVNDGFEYALIYSRLSTKISLYLSLIFLLSSIFIGGYALFIKLFIGQVASGWTTTMVFLSFGFSGIFAILMIVCKYLEIIIKNTLFKSGYRVSSIENFSL